jgi:hypothetical protein
MFVVTAMFAINSTAITARATRHKLDGLSDQARPAAPRPGGSTEAEP